MNPPPPDDTPTLTIGRPDVPGYELRGELGRGGMGVVYEALRMSTGERVAVKVIRDAALASEDDRRRFRIEAEATARLDHPNVVRVLEVGEHAGRPFLVMELLTGGTLATRLGRTAWPPRSAAELVHTLADAVAHAHARNVVHRDLKPGNVLLQTADVQPASEDRSDPTRSTVVYQHSAIPKVADFGLAKRLDADSTAWTRDGAVLGTPCYMSPEQAAGRVREVGPPADVYALGVILYEALTGKPPHLADSWQQTLQRVIHDDPTPPTREQPDIPAALEAVCLKCLAKEPARRYPTAAELAADLGRFLAGEVVSAVPETSFDRLTRHAARDGYQLGGEVGRSTHATTYLARTAFGQPVAVKVFSAGRFTRDEWNNRLRHGAATLAVLAHPHVVRVFGGGWWDGSPFLVSEHAPTGSLAGHIGERPQPVAESIRLVAELAELLGYVHRQGVTHGNLKPTNVLLAADGIPRITDFRATLGLPDITDPATIATLAPELLADPAAELRPHSDVYGLGLILYQLLTGRPPFDSTDPDLRERVANADPSRPSVYNSHVPPPLDSICLRCLRANPWARYPRAFDLFTRLRWMAENV